MGRVREVMVGSTLSFAIICYLLSLIAANTSNMSPEEEYPFGFWYDGELAKLRAGRSPRTVKDDRSLSLIHAISHYGNEKRDVRTRQGLDNIKDEVHHHVLAELLNRWRFHHPDSPRSRLIRYQKRSEDRSDDLYGFIKKTVVPFPRIG